MIGPLVAVSGQFHHGGSLGGRDCVVGTPAAVAVGQCGGTMLAVGCQQPAGVARAHPQHLSGLGDGYLEFQNGVEHGKSGLFFLVQRYVLHHKDIFADQLADDGIVEQRQEFLTQFGPGTHLQIRFENIVIQAQLNKDPQQHAYSVGSGIEV